MNGLSPSQLEQIQQQLLHLGTRYYDVRMEVLDHVATSIEEKLNIDTKVDFTAALQNELKEWPEKRIKNLIKKKSRSLKWSWHKRLGTYMLDFITLPKIILSLSIFSFCLYFLSQPLIFHEFIETVTIWGFWIYLIAICYMYYKEYDTSHSYPPPLLTVQAYNRIINSLPMGAGMVMWIGGEHFNQLSYSISSSIIISFIVTFTILLTFAFLFVFPKQLKSDVMNYYHPLGIYD